MGLFFYTQKGSIISTVVLPTTEIIEPTFLRDDSGRLVFIMQLKDGAYIEQDSSILTFLLFVVHYNTL